MRFQPELVAATGDVICALILSKIIAWNQPDKNGRTYLRVRRKGTLWLAKSRETMCKDTGITIHQYKRAMPILVKQGWIVMERGLFAGKVTPHIQLAAGTANRLEALTANQLEAGTSKHYNQTKDNETKPKDLAGGKPMATAAEILKTTGKDKTQNTNLEVVWKDLMHTVTGEWQKPWTGEEKGKLKTLRSYLGDQTPKIVRWVIPNWPLFMAYVNQKHKPDWVPGQPHLGFLLKYCDSAVAAFTAATAGLQSIAAAGIDIPKETGHTQGIAAPIPTQLDEDDEKVLKEILGG